jgi:hypothetical protein
MPTTPRSMMVPFLSAAMTPKSTPPTIHMMKAISASDIDTGKVVLISELTVAVFTTE